MATFAFEAVDATGRTIRSRVEADSQDQAVARLREMHYRVYRMREVRGASPVGWLVQRFRRVRLREMGLFTRQFAVMINAGLSVVRCLDILGTQSGNAYFASILEQVKNDVRAGHSLADALQRAQPVFSELYVNMVRAAEAAGILDTVLDRLAQYLEKEMQVIGQVKSAMTYPILVLCFAMGAVGIIVFYIMPKFSEVFSEMEITLPIYTKILIGSAQWLKTYFWVPFLIIFIAWTSIRAYGRNEKGRYNIDLVKMRVPAVGPLLHKLALSRFSRTLGTLRTAGIPIMRALEIVADTAGNRVVSTAVLEARDRVREGQPLSEPLARHPRIFPVMVTQMIAVGEQTGREDVMLQKISDFYDEEVDAAIKSLTSIIEPLLIVGLGCLVAFIAVSVITPIYDIAGSIK
jgi:type IV pilus assembly protein PilC